jgi:MOSC domain-containing protein YiiM
VSAVLTQINISAGGMPKLPVLQAQVATHGLVGDRQKNLKVHGGLNRAICIYSEELYQWLRDSGINVSNGQIGENFTTRGLDLGSLKTGDRLRVGKCTIEITKVRTPCSQLTKWDPDLPYIIVGRSGWMAKVIEEGAVKPGDEIHLIVDCQMPIAE